MAAAMARKYGSDVIEAGSAGLSPAYNVGSLTRAILDEKNIDLGDHLPRGFRDLDHRKWDLIVNISGQLLPGDLDVPVENWNVPDPFGGTEEDFRAVREQLEMLVMRLILRLRAGKI